ncbi:MAG TPA: UrcA family protein [Caulobacteraceae bacterium]
MSALLALPALAAAQSAVHEIVVQGRAAGTEVRSEKVAFSDLNLDHPAGAKTLLSRLHGAAERVCGISAGRTDRDYKSCVDTALNRAVDEVGAPLLSSLHQSHG